MKHLRKFNESKQDIESICQKYGITNYTINEDGSIDVDDNVNLANKELDELPLKFRNVAGFFYCDHNKLVNLEGAPKSVGGSFDCSSNKLTSLEGGPQSVGGNFDCSINKLTTLEGSPKSINVVFSCSSNRLVNLEFTPSCLVLYCGDNPINKWWWKVNDISKLDAFIDLGVDARDPDFMNEEKIDLLNE